MHRTQEPRPHRPNQLSRAARLFNLALGLLLLGYGVAGITTAHVDLHGAKVRIAVLEGGPAWLMGAALIAGASVLLSVVVDHYDLRDNENYYRTFRWVATRLGCALAASALVAHLYIGFTS